MWNAPDKPISRDHIIDTALDALEASQEAILSEFEPAPYQEALKALRDVSTAKECTLNRYEKAFNHPIYSPPARYEAVGQALRLIKSSLGR